jgi:hypothetical protein
MNTIIYLGISFIFILREDILLGKDSDNLLKNDITLLNLYKMIIFKLLNK